MQFRILGPLEAVGPDGPIELGGRKRRALLAVLLINAGRVVSTDRLIDALWGSDPPRRADKALQVYVSYLRKALATSGFEHMLLTRKPGYMLDVESHTVDAFAFEQLIGRARAEAARRAGYAASACFRRALALWRGDVLGDLLGEPFAQVESARLSELRLAALEELVDIDLELGRHEELVIELEAIVARHPTRERLAGGLMLALYRCGRQVDALRVYREMHANLIDELGIEPGPELDDLHTKILRQEASLRFVPDQTAPTPNNLPAAATSFIGRAEDLNTVKMLLKQHRLVTLTGPGGCGKSRLALEAGGQLLEGHPDGVWLVELAPLTDGNLVGRTILSAVGLSEQPRRGFVETVTAALRSKTVLLVLDNCEHIIDGSAGVVAALLASCPRVTILATSREPLAIPGEVCWDVPPLAVPTTSAATSGCVVTNEAVELFFDRVRAARGARAFAPGDAEVAAEICRRLDGMPLAIELAAPLARTMSFEQIATRLDDRFGLLTRGSRTALPRHRTLRAAIEWSYRLLDECERRVLNRLSVFAGGFTIPAVESVCADGVVQPSHVLQLVSRLVDKSLVVVQERSGGGRYRLLETIRVFAAEKLDATGETDAVKDRHAGFYRRLGEQSERHLQGAGQAEWLERLDSEHDNFRLALAWLGARGYGEELTLMSAALWRYCYLRGHYIEGRRWLERAVAMDSVSPVARAQALVGAGALALYQCDYDRAHELCQEALQLFVETGDRRGGGNALTLLGAVARERGNCVLSARLHEEALGAFQSALDEWGVAHSLQMSGFAAWLNGEFEHAAVLSTESLRRFERLQDRERAAWALMNLGAVAFYQGRPGRARELLNRCLVEFRSISFKEGVAWSLNLLGVVEAAEAGAPAALPLLKEGLILHRELGDRWRACSVLEGIALAIVRDEPQKAARLLGAAQSVRDSLGTPVPVCERCDYERGLGILRGALGPESTEAGLVDGRMMSFDDACGVAIEAGKEEQPQELCVLAS